MREEWFDFKEGKWNSEINVSDFILNNYTVYTGDSSFLSGISEKTDVILKRIRLLDIVEKQKGVLDVELKIFSGIDSFKPGYISKENEVIVGLQTDAPLKLIVNPYGGLRLATKSLASYGYELDEKLYNDFKSYRKTHNEGVFDAYTHEMLLARSAGLLTGLPDAYGRGRIIGDYRRVPLYGVDYLIEEKKKDYANHSNVTNSEMIQLREEINEQITALEKLKTMALTYDIDLSLPASTAKDAVQFLYLAYLATIKENNGAAMSFGRNANFLDIYIERDLKNGVITELEAQELIDQLVLKLRLVRHLRAPAYNELFAGDPTWVTESIGGMANDNRPLVTKSSFRFLHTLINLGPAPEPNLTILWSESLPEHFKKFCTYISIKTDAIQYENDDLMRPIFGDDYAIACCVSAMTIGKQMQFFGARCNSAKALLYAINGGVDEVEDNVVMAGLTPITDDILDYETVKNKYFEVIEKLAVLYVDTMNVIHYMHDKYAYEASQMALHDTDVDRLMAFGIAGLSVAADSLSAIKYAKVRAVRNEAGIAKDFIIEGDYPKFGNDDDRVDSIAIEIVTKLSNELKKHKLYRNAKHTLSVLTITSNVVYGKKTGSTPDGRMALEPFAPGANPMHNRDMSGALASLNSVAKLPYKDVCEDGISNTFSITPSTLGSDLDTQISNLVNIIDGYFGQNAHHLNVNVLNREMLIDAMENPDKYPLLTIRVSGYAVLFSKLSKDHQKEVISRTFHDKM